MILKDNFAGLRKKVDDFGLDSVNIKNLLIQAEKNNYELQANSIDTQVLEQEYEWFKNEKNTDISLNGRYNTDGDELTIGMSLSYVFYDGGQREIELKQKKADIKNNRDKYETLKEQLKLELEKKQNQIQLSQSKLKQNQLQYDKSLLEEKIAKARLDKGIITENEYTKAKLNCEEAKINLTIAQDDLFIKKLYLLGTIKNESFFKKY